MKMRNSLFILIGVMVGGCAASGSYLEVHKPWDRIFQKRTYGGAADLIGTELNAPSFTLYANGMIASYSYRDNKRRLSYQRLNREAFLNLYHGISIAMLFDPQDSAYAREVNENRELAEAPTTELTFYSKRLSIRGLGMYRHTPALDSVQSFFSRLDRRGENETSVFQVDSVRLYVKKMSAGDPTVWPKWPISTISPDSLYREPIRFYEPNSERNGETFHGEVAREIQKKIEQTSIYLKFSYRNEIYAVGYRPLLP